MTLKKVELETLSVLCKGCGHREALHDENGCHRIVILCPRRECPCKKFDEEPRS